MKAKSYIKTVLILLSLSLALLAGLTIIVDPLFQYHKPWFRLEPVIINERYQNAGMAKNFEFDNVILGNSMSENFRVSWFEEYYEGKTIKLTAAGSKTLDWTYTLNILHQRGIEIENIFMNMDPYILNADPEEMTHELPEYLYDNNYFNDFSYLLNASILRDFTYRTLLSNLTGNVPEINEAFVWDKEGIYGKKDVLEKYRITKTEDNDEKQDFSYIVQRTEENMEHIIPYIESMQETEFIFFFSPFSIIYWYQANADQRLDYWEDAYLCCMEKLVEYDNVSIYFWSDDTMKEIITDWNNYKDESHYSAEISRLILDRIGNDEGRINKDNYEVLVKDYFTFLKGYQYEILW